MSLFNDYFKAVYAALNGDALFTGKISESLSDVSSFPMIWIEDGGSSDWSDKDYDGLEAVITLHIGSQYRGTKEIRTWMDKAHSLLHDASLTLATEQSVLCRFLRSEIVTDSDSITRHGVMRFSLLINEVS